MNKQNNYELGKKLIHESYFSVKAVKTFMGMEGTGVNANIYFKNRKRKIEREKHTIRKKEKKGN